MSQYSWDRSKANVFGVNRGHFAFHKKSAKLVGEVYIFTVIVLREGLVYIPKGNNIVQNELVQFTVFKFSVSGFSNGKE